MQGVMRRGKHHYLANGMQERCAWSLVPGFLLLYKLVESIFRFLLHKSPFPLTAPMLTHKAPTVTGARPEVRHGVQQNAPLAVQWPCQPPFQERVHKHHVLQVHRLLVDR